MGSNGIARAILAYLAWGLFPFYWKQVAHVPAPQVMGHRVFWSFVTLAIVAVVMRRVVVIGRSARSFRVVLLYAAAAAVIAANWLAYIWAVNHGWIVETSLGYFINPLVNVLLGVVFLGERLRSLQWLAVAFAAAGVAYLTWHYEGIPWIALILAITFAVYGLLKKLAPLGPLDGLTLETSIGALPAAVYLIYANQTGEGAYAHAGTASTLYLTGAGVVTTLPLVLFASAVREVPLSLIGLLQYISPTLQLAAGVWVYREPFTREQFIGFSAVWLGLAVFAWDGWSSSGKRRRVALRHSPR
jgi:chloramphenicol-sensitive protein RarD